MQFRDMQTDLLLFDDALVPQLEPLTSTRAAADLRCGILTVAEKWGRRFPQAKVLRDTRPSLRPLYEGTEGSEAALWINARWLPDAKATALVQGLASGEGLCKDDIVLAARPDRETAGDWRGGHPWNTSQIQWNECEYGALLERPSDLFRLNEAQILEDLPLAGGGVFDYTWHPGVMVEHPERILLGTGVKIEPGVVMIPDGGTIHIGDGAVIQAGALIRGNVSIGEGATVRMGAHIYTGTSIGPNCKVGGEMQNVVMFGYSNKAHGGFLGNSVVAEWVNIGADANTSNLKNNYTNIRLEDWHTGDVVDSGLQFFGAVFADHTKIAIGSKINSGSFFGVSSSFVSNDFSPKRTPHFGWVTDAGLEDFEIERALGTARAMMARRGVDMGAAMEGVLRGFAAK